MLHLAADSLVSGSLPTKALLTGFLPPCILKVPSREGHYKEDAKVGSTGSMATLSDPWLCCARYSEQPTRALSVGTPHSGAQ